MDIRHARSQDIEIITDIYNDAVLNTTAIWNDIPVDSTNRLAWLQDHEKADYPVLVAVDEQDTVLGYATFGEWRAFAGYRHTVEHSIYVHHHQRGRGLGRRLLERLICEARLRGKHAMIAGIETGNMASIALHKKVGFEHVGQLPQVGVKFNRWLDLTFLQLILDQRPSP